MKISVSKKDTIWSFIGTALSMGANLIILPVILEYLDDDAIGLYYVFSSLSAIAALFDFGFSPSFARSIAYAWSGATDLKREGNDGGVISETNYGLMMAVMRSCRIIYSVLAGAALLIGISIGTMYISSITNSFSGNTHMVSWFIYLLAITLNILYGYYSVLLRGVGAVADVNKAMIIARITQIAFCITLSFAGCGLVGVAIAYLLYGISFRLIAKKRFLQYNDIETKISKVANANEYTVRSVISTIWPNTWRDGFVTLSNYLLNQGTTIIASLCLSLHETGVYSLCVQLATAVVTISATLYTTYQPALQSAYVNKDIKAQRKYMSMIVVSYCVLCFIGMLCVILFGKPLIAWIRPSYAFSISVMIWVGFYQFMLKFRNCYATYFSTTNRIVYTKSFVVSAIICLALSIVFCVLLKLGVYGLIIAQIFSQLMYNAWHWMLKAHNELELSFAETLRIGFHGLLNTTKRERS